MFSINPETQLSNFFLKELGISSFLNFFICSIILNIFRAYPVRTYAQGTKTLNIQISVPNSTGTGLS